MRKVPRWRHRRNAARPAGRRVEPRAAGDGPANLPNGILSQRVARRQGGLEGGAEGCGDKPHDGERHRELATGGPRVSRSATADVTSILRRHPHHRGAPGDRHGQRAAQRETDKDVERRDVLRSLTDQPSSTAPEEKRNTSARGHRRAEQRKRVVPLGGRRLALGHAGARACGDREIRLQGKDSGGEDDSGTVR